MKTTSEKLADFFIVLSIVSILALIIQIIAYTELNLSGTVYANICGFTVLSIALNFAASIYFSLKN